MGSLVEVANSSAHSYLVPMNRAMENLTGTP
jgi:hypothetical protein